MWVRAWDSFGQPLHPRQAGPALLSSFPPRLQERTRKQLERLGVEVVCGRPVADIGADGYRLGDHFVPCRTVLWAAGVAASPLGALLVGDRRDLLDRAGRVKVEPDLSLPGHPEVFIAGDLAAVTRHDNGQPVPGVAPAAKQMGSHVAGAMRARLRGAGTSPFVYRDYGNLATIGRMAAVVDLRGLQFSGLPAWCFWLAAHVFFLIGFRNRISVLVNWGWSYFTYQRSARIVLGDQAARAPAQTDQAASSVSTSKPSGAR